MFSFFESLLDPGKSRQLLVIVKILILVLAHHQIVSINQSQPQLPYRNATIVILGCSQELLFGPKRQTMSGGQQRYGPIQFAVYYNLQY